jgi:hypothetical protein
MNWFEDDSHTIPDYIKNMSQDELKHYIEILEEKARIERKVKQQAHTA